MRLRHTVIGLTAAVLTVSGASAASAAPVETVPAAKKNQVVTMEYGSMEACVLDGPYMWFSGYDLVRGCEASGGTANSQWVYNTGWF